MPILDQDTVVGIIALIGRQPFVVGPEEQMLLENFAAQAAIAICNARLYAQVQHHATALEHRITAQEKAEASLRLLSRAIEHTADSVMITDTHGVILFVNPAFERLTGYSREEAVGNTPRLLKSGQHSPEFYKTLWTTICAGQTFQATFVNRRKDGTLYYEEKILTPVKDDQGHIVHFVSTGRDITERKQAEEERERLQEQVRQMQKIQAIGTLAGGIAHDFNNILAAILGYTELALFDVPPESKIWPHLQAVLEAGDRAKHLVQQILTFSRQHEQERKPVSLRLLLKETLKLLRATLPATIEIRQSCRTAHDMILADPTQLHQVLLNLCTNAEYAMRERGGVLEVSLDTVEIDATVAAAHPPLQPGSYVRLTVRDTGPGMPPEVVERIFEPYFTTKPEGEGTGLGLAVVHGIVASHGGTITVESRVGKGTTFTIYLPSLTASTETNSSVPEPVPRGTERILFVDDEEALARLGYQILTHLGYEVTVRTSSLEALEAFRAAPYRFDLVITDQTMPQMTGEAFSQAIREIRPDIPIILCTGFSHTMSKEKARQLGINAFLLKPLTTADLGKVIRQVLASAESMTGQE
ncbi:MAG: hybrid sensor histidine kinase/response regulator [Nitrospinota bacterium]|nr:MAG: hybrid sensor histidine kinase/response regulator [Nitrospinota bacterium]